MAARRVMSRVLLWAVGGSLLLAGCAATDPCLKASRVRRPSPSGRRVALVYRGGCPNVALAPQVLVEFSGGGGGGVLAVRDSAARIGARWGE